MQEHPTTWPRVFATLDRLQALDWTGVDPPKPAAKRNPMPVPAWYRARPRFKARPWFHDISAVAQRRRAVKRHHGRADPLTLAFVEYRKRECVRLRHEGHSWREIGRLQGIDYSTARHHVLNHQPDPWDVAMSQVLVDRHLDETPGCGMPTGTTRRVTSTRRWWKQSPLVQYTDAAAWRARDGTWHLGCYRC